MPNAAAAARRRLCSFPAPTEMSRGMIGRCFFRRRGGNGQFSLLAVLARSRCNKKQGASDSPRSTPREALVYHSSAP
eukprot:12969494-Alexandrium_andersonii.AAC.1